jgi:hypothetical protein
MLSIGHNCCFNQKQRITMEQPEKPSSKNNKAFALDLLKAIVVVLLVTGLTYSISSHLYFLATGKSISSWWFLSVLARIVSWPWSIRGNIVNSSLQIYDVLTIFAFVVACLFFVNKFFKRTDKGEQKSLVFMQLIRRLIISYFTIGLLFSITGYIERAIEKKPEVFSPLVGIPFDIIGWPWSLWGNTVHNDIGFQAFTTWFSCALALIIVLFSCIKDCRKLYNS